MLLTPDPTNTLMALAGAKAGFVRAVRLIPAELLGYLTVVLPLAFLGAEAVSRYPVASQLIKAAAAMWIMALAFRLWHKADFDGAPGGVTARDVFVTTVVNPKALVIGLVLLPSPTDPAFAFRLGLFICIVILAALAWIAGGRMALGREGRSRNLRTIRRIASLWLALIAGTLIVALLRE